MPTYELVVQTEPQEHAALLRLMGPNGNELFRRRVSLQSDARWQGLFYTQSYVERFAGSLRDAEGRVKTAEALLEELGAFLGREVLGPEIIEELCKSKKRRTLLLRLSEANEALASAFVRVPWELARPDIGRAPLMDRGVVMRAVTERTSAGDSLVRAATKEMKNQTLRVLLVFAEAPGSRPLAMRSEREALRRLFEDEIMPRRRVTLDVLCHGVTRTVLEEQIRDRGGYDVVHWSGHGKHNTLELTGEDGARLELTGENLVEIFVGTRGFVPHLFFLSACMSDAFAWAEVTSEDEDEDKNSSVVSPESDLKQMPGYAGAALTLLHAGVPQVVAMRYGVGDDYARELARQFYKRLLADRRKRTTEDALAMARSDVSERGTPMAKRTPADHASALMMGQNGRWIDPPARRDKPRQASRPVPQPLLVSDSRELDPPEFFVGRGVMLTRVNRAWRSRGTGVTVVQGMAGLGKTSMAAEAIHLWHERFDYVLAFQAKPTELRVETFLQQVDQRLGRASSTYRTKREESPFERVYLETGGELLSNDERYAQMIVNLVEALRAEAVLVVLDNFESNLEDVQSRDGYACKDPHWDAVLRALSKRLPETRSRLLMTTRHRPRALAGKGTEWLPLGPLPSDEAMLYVRSHEGLSTLLGDDPGRSLASRLLQVTQGHPLILDRLAALVKDRTELDKALNRLKSEGLHRIYLLMNPLTNDTTKAEQDYLEQVAVGSVDLLLERVSTEARRLLWVATLAFEAVRESILTVVWTRVLDEQSEMQPLLRELDQASLVTREEPLPSTDVDEAASTTVVFHELVRERIATWMHAHPDERNRRTAEQVWMGYGQHYSALFRSRHLSGKQLAREATDEIGRRALVYLVRARDFEGLGSFASMLVTGTRDPALLGAVVTELRAVTNQVPAGQARWRVRSYLADALTRLGRPDEALPLYEEAVREAQQAEQWSDVAGVYGNWANALGDVGYLDASKTTHLRSAEAELMANGPRVNIVGSELEALRIDVMQGRAAQVLPDIEVRLEEVRGWWKAQAESQPPHEAPEWEILGRALVSSLDIAVNAYQALEQWQKCLEMLGEIERIERAMGESKHEQAHTRFKAYLPLLRLGRLDKAQRVIERCMTEFRKTADAMMEGEALSALGALWAERKDLPRATDLERQALAIFNSLPNPEGRAASHENLANYLDRSGQPGAPAHRLASLAYRLVTGQGAQMSATFINLADAKQKVDVDTTYDLPRLVDTLAHPALDALHRFLTTRKVDLLSLQAEIDQRSDYATR